MISRCYSEKAAMYHRYGGRGIAVCDRWRADFFAFVEDVPARPSPEHSIDRIDNDGNYEPGNVRWATHIEQSRNQGKSRMVTIDGRTMCVAAWAEEVGIPDGIIRGRLFRGWDPVRAVTTGVRKRAALAALVGERRGHEKNQAKRSLVYACDSCDFTLVDPTFAEDCAVVPGVMCRYGKRMRSLGMQPGTKLVGAEEQLE